MRGFFLLRTKKMTPVTAMPITNKAQAALAASFVAVAAPAKVYAITGYNSKASAQFIQLFDANGLPADASVPIQCITVPAASNFSFDFGFHGMDFSNGVVVCNSSTAPAKTIGAADCQFFVRLTPI